MSELSQRVRAVLLQESKDFEIVPGIVLKVARTPVGEGLAAYMRIIERWRENIWNPLAELNDRFDAFNETIQDKSEEEKKAIKDSQDQQVQTLIGAAKLKIQSDDAVDVVPALYFSVFRLDKTIDREDIVEMLDNTNIDEAVRVLIEVNTFDREKMQKKDNPQTTGTTSETNQN